MAVFPFFEWLESKAILLCLLLTNSFLHIYVCSGALKPVKPANSDVNLRVYEYPAGPPGIHDKIVGGGNLTRICLIFLAFINLYV